MIATIKRWSRFADDAFGYAKKHWRLVLAIILGGMILWAAYLHWGEGRDWADWTGFGESVKVIIPSSPPGVTTPIPPVVDYQPAKTLWDFLVFLLGASVAVMIALLNQKNEERRKKLESDKTTDNQREAALQNYLDKIDYLILEKRLMEVKGFLEAKTAENEFESTLPHDLRSVQDIAQVRTVTVLRQLDTLRRDIVFQFLHDTGLSSFILMSASLKGIALVESDMLRINLSRADLDGANLTKANLDGANLFEAKLCGAILVGVNLSKANLTRANLIKADLTGTLLESARLNGVIAADAKLIGADLTQADLSGANLDRANLRRAQLRSSNLRSASLTGANLRRAYLGAADLTGAFLNSADLSGAYVFDHQLVTAESLSEAIMPDGMKFDPTIHIFWKKSTEV